MARWIPWRVLWMELWASTSAEILLESIPLLRRKPRLLLVWRDELREGREREIRVLREGIRVDVVCYHGRV